MREWIKIFVVGIFVCPIGHAAFSVSAAGSAAWALSLEGDARVIDGDTLEIDEQQVRLHGIDAPESLQFCEREGERYPCGQESSSALMRKISQDSVRCDRHGMDEYQRIIGVCWLKQENLNAWMVREGWAVAYQKHSLDYIADEEAARAEKKGIWAGNFIAPEQWRHGERLEGEMTSRQEPAEQKCDIKGNISGSGTKVYHVPSGMFYKLIKINKHKGERWFCSEEEARRAGWRRSAE